MDPVISGGIVATFAFVLARGWDLYQARTVRDKHDQAVIRAARGEVSTNRGIIESNERLLGDYPDWSYEMEEVPPPLERLQAGIWDLVKVDPPRVLFEHPDSLAVIRDVVRRTALVNRAIEDRERHRILNRESHLGRYNKALRAYDEVIVQSQRELLTAIGRLEPLLEVNRAGPSDHRTAHPYPVGGFGTVDYGGRS